MHKKFTATIAAIVIGLPCAAQAGKTYTAAELNAMLAQSKPPAQGAGKSESRAADYSTCLLRLASVLASVDASYPTRTVVDTAQLRVEKLWANDSAMTVTCSAADKKITITTAPYL
jgi:hypothetical protein